MKQAMIISFIAVALMIGLGYLQGLVISGAEAMICLVIMTFIYRFTLMTFKDKGAD